MAAIPSRDISRILITRLRFLGDVVLTTPLIREVHRAFPEAYVAYLAEKPFGEILQNNPHLKEIISLERKEIASLPLPRRAFAHAGFIKDLREKDWDLVIDLLGNPRSGLLAFLSGAKYRFGPARRGRAAYYTHLVAEPDRSHTQIETHLEFLNYLGMDPHKADQKTEIFVSNQEKTWAFSYLAENRLVSHPLILLHPGASWPAKRWLPERFAQVATRLQRDLKASIVLLCGPNEQGRTSEVLQAMSGKSHVAEGLTIRQMTALLSECDLFITNDAGPMHIACALGRPTLALFGPGDPQAWFPYLLNDKQVAIHRPPSCWPCHLDVCEPLDCLKAITADEVTEKAKQLLALTLQPTPRNPKVLCPT